MKLTPSEKHMVLKALEHTSKFYDTLSREVPQLKAVFALEARGYDKLALKIEEAS